VNIFTDKKMEADFWYELRDGKDTGNALAKKAADGVRDVMELARKELNEAGFDIPKLADYGSPQKMSYWRMHKEVSRVGFDKVVDDLLPRLNRDKYVNPDGTLMTDAQTRQFVREAIQTIITDGANKDPGKGSGTLANRGKAHRQLHWKDADSFMYIMNKYSESNAVDMIYHHLEGMARDLTMVQKLGPNAIDSFVTKMRDLYDTAQDAKDIQRLKSVEHAFESYSGLTSEIVNPTIHRVFSTVKTAMSAMLLGSNTITQLSDQATLTATARAMRMPVFDAFKNEAIFAASSGYRDVTRSMGYGLESLSNQISRFADASQGNFFGKVSNLQMQINLSAFMTNMVRSSFGHAMANHIGGMTRRYQSMADLLPADRALLESKGVTESVWKIWQEAELNTEYNGTALTARNIYDVPEERILAAVPSLQPREASAMRDKAAMQLLSMTLEETYMASVQPSAATQEIWKVQRGKFFSELGGLFAQFKSFPMAMLVQHVIQRGGMNGNGFASRAAYTIPLITMGTLTGAMALWLNDIASGRDPRSAYEEDDPKKLAKFAMQSFAKGGGAGIFGDLLNVDWSRDPLKALSGPGVSWAVQASGVAARSVNTLLATGTENYESEAKKLGQDMTQLTRSSIPLGNLWWAKAALHNYALKDVYELMNPGYHDRVRGAAEKNYSAGYWTDEPRFPQLSNISGAN
jgi:hypothetical protein